MTERNDFLRQTSEVLAERLASDARRNREHILELGGVVVRELLAADAEAIQMTEEGETREVWIRRDANSAPTASAGTGPECLSFMLEGENPYRGRIERLRVLVPVPDGLDEDDPEAVRAMSDPDELYIERTVPQPYGKQLPVIGRYAVTHDVSFPYVLNDDEDVPYDNAALNTFSDAALRVFVTQRARSELNRLDRILEDMANWEAKPQRRTIQGEGQVVDL